MGADLYTWKNFVKAVRNPRIFINEFRRLSRRPHNAVHTFRRDQKGVKVVEEDWDNLLILDACRYDMFAEQHDLKGELQSRISLGSNSLEFMERNFKGESLLDVVYVTANPYVFKLEEVEFYRVIDLLDEWDRDLQTVHPESVVRAAKRVHDRYPDKRLIVHFMQPHYPFIGEKGQKLDVRGYYKDVDEHNEEVPSVWDILRDNPAGYDNVTEGAVWEAYRENLDLVLSYVADLLESFSGKSVVTADHGNMVGERLYPIPIREYGHPRRLYSPPLVKVPWLVIESDERRRTVAESPESDRERNAETVDSQLRALGYRE